MAAADYPRSRAGAAAPALRAVADALALGPQTDVLDIGCGPGDFCLLATERGAPVSGIDLGSDVIDIARTRVPSADLRVGPMEACPWPDATIDPGQPPSTPCSSPTIPRYRCEVCRLLRPSGRLAICTWSAGSTTRPNARRRGLHPSALRASVVGSAESAPRQRITCPGGAGAPASAGSSPNPLRSGQVAESPGRHLPAVIPDRCRRRAGCG